MKTERLEYSVVTRGGNYTPQMCDSMHWQSHFTFLLMWQWGMWVRLRLSIGAHLRCEIQFFRLHHLWWSYNSSAAGRWLHLSLCGCPLRVDAGLLPWAERQPRCKEAYRDQRSPKKSAKVAAVQSEKKTSQAVLKRGVQREFLSCLPHLSPFNDIFGEIFAPGDVRNKPHHSFDLLSFFFFSWVFFCFCHFLPLVLMIALANCWCKQTDTSPQYTSFLC